MCPCLIDTTSDTMLIFRPEEGQSEWRVEIKGQEQLLDKVMQAYSCWIETKGADFNVYRLEIGASGKQRVILASKDGEYEPTWIIP